jgi:hypothetical protein
MISSNCNLKEFVKAIEDKDYSDIIFWANKEATEAERIALHSANEMGEKEMYLIGYANDLKDLIFFLRSNIKPKKHVNKFGQLSEKFLQDI